MEEKVLMEAKGEDGQLQLLEDRVRIIKVGITIGGRLVKDIFIKDISSIQFVKAGLMTVGYIQFNFNGMTQGSIWTGAYDVRTVSFTRRQEPAFEKIKEAIEEKIRSNEKVETKTPDLDQLEKLAELKEKGIITEEEFNAKKKQILGL